ncbi:IGL1 protein, partial [Formicarius rufipectus]|nr:IGL1 protein [Formicarius rufipectus]
IGYYNKVFGTGTKLIVSDKKTSAPTSSEILQRKHENQLIYVCLIEKFYPDVIRVTWTHEGKEVTDNVVRGNPWPTKEDKYSVASWLTVPAEDKDKKYQCKYEHEGKEDSLSTQAHSPSSAHLLGAQSFVQSFGIILTLNNTFLSYVVLPDDMLPDHLMHRTAYLVYIILLLKSSMYYLIILFFIYR